ncbi:MAG: hypothetical protein WAV31_04735 [Candidatus Moraniibacteriota bacterium]
MKLIILPGNGQANKEWADDAGQAFLDIFEDQYEQYYSHWDTGEEIINLDIELKKLKENIGNEKEYIVFAKSAGSLLSIYGVFDGDVKPKRCIFVGLPISWAKENNFPLEIWLEKYDILTVIIQNSNDPYTPFEEVQEMIQRLDKKNIKVIEILGNNHKYDDFELIKNKIKNLL